MSKRSKKQGRPTVARDPSTYLSAVERHRRILKASADRWDTSRDPDEVVIMAAALRTLLGDGDRLLDRVVSIKRGVMFCDTEVESPEDHGAGQRMGAGGLSLIRLDDGGATVVPVCELPDPEEPRWIRFRAWWQTNQPIRQDSLRCSREFLVHEVANTDGLHVDSVLDADYEQLTRGMTGIVTMNNVSHPLGSVVPACVRQIAWEAERTLAVALASIRLEGTAHLS